MRVADIPRPVAREHQASVCDDTAGVTSLIRVFFLAGAVTTGRLTATAGPKATLILGALLGAVALAGLASAHDDQAELYLWPTLVALGVGITYGAMAALILAESPEEHRGQSTSINVILRTIGSSIGIQLAASAHGGTPPERGFTDAFVLMAAATVLGALVAVVIPARRRHAVQPAVAADGLPAG